MPRTAVQIEEHLEHGGPQGRESGLSLWIFLGAALRMDTVKA
jgi:hypothetical protein